MNSTNETHVVVEYHSNKKTKVFYICRNGKPDGLYMEYHDNGNVKKEVNYVGGVKHGEYKVYHRNGNICAGETM
jgi:antitoxin component YwqK of YwqJK toxin-antitoxin module